MLLDSGEESDSHQHAIGELIEDYDSIICSDRTPPL